MINKNALKGLALGLAIPLLLAALAWPEPAHIGQATASSKSCPCPPGQQLSNCQETT